MPPLCLLLVPACCYLSSVPLWPSALFFCDILPRRFSCRLHYGLYSSPQFIHHPLSKLLANLLHFCDTFYNGGPLGTTAKYGPQAKRLSCTVDKGLLEMLMTHLVLGFVSLSVMRLSGVFPPLFLWRNQLNLFTCHIWVLMCLDSLLVLMNVIHSSMESLSKMPLSRFIHVSI